MGNDGERSGAIAVAITVEAAASFGGIRERLDGGATGWWSRGVVERYQSNMKLRQWPVSGMSVVQRT